MLKWWALVIVSLALSPATARSVDVRYANGDIQLAAELMLPEKGTPQSVPAVVLIQGSGSSDRSNEWARKIGQVFVDRGIAVLLTDKRGSGKSQGDWRTAGFDELAEDALAGVRFLKTRPEIDTSRIGLAGLSQGGRVAPVAAAKSPDVTFVVSLVTDAVTFPEQSFVEMANTARQAGLPADQVAAVVALNAAAGRFLLGGSWDEYSRMRKEMLAGPAAEIAGGFPAEQGAAVWTFLRKVVAFDPLPYWVSMRQPALLVFGEADERDNVPVQESIRRLKFALGTALKDDVQISVIPGVGHALMDQPDRLAPAFIATLREWLEINVINTQRST